MSSVTQTTQTKSSRGLRSYFDRVYESIVASGESESNPNVRAYCVAGRNLHVHFLDERLESALVPAMQHLGTDGSTSAQLSIFVVHGAGNGRVPAPWEFIHQSDSCCREMLYPRAYFSDGQSLRGAALPGRGVVSMLDRERRVAIYWLRDVTAVPMSERRAPFQSIFQWWLGDDGCQIVHAGAVGTSDGAVLIVGKGGSGKSTTSLACGTHGHFYLGDDSILCRVEPSPTVFALYNVGALNPEDITKFPSLRQAVGSPGIRGVDKTLLYVGRSAAMRSAPCLPLRAILFPRPTGRAETTFRGLSSAEVLLALAPSSMLNLPGDGKPTFKNAAKLAQSVPGYLLETGTDLRGISKAVEDLISQCPQRSPTSQVPDARRTSRTVRTT